MSTYYKGLRVKALLFGQEKTKRPEQGTQNRPVHVRILSMWQRGP